MSHSFSSTSNRVWLKENHKERSKRSIELGKKTIDQLIKKGSPVTYSSIAEQSKEIDPEGKGIHANTIRTNDQLYEYYKKHSKTYKQKENTKNNRSNHSVNVDEKDYRKINPKRNVEIVKRKYMKLSKQELVHRLMLAEQYIAENNTKWVANHFEMFK